MMTAYSVFRIKAKTALVCGSLLAVLVAGCAQQDEIIAKVNDRKIFQKDFQQYLSLKNIPADNQDLVMRHMDEYLEREAMADLIEKTPLAEELQVKSQMNELRKQLLIQGYVDQQVQEQVTDAAINDYYQANIKKYQEEQIRVAHVLIRMDESMPSEERQARLNKAQEAYSLANTDMPFTDVVTHFSEDTRSISKGGDLGWISPGTIDPVFSKTVFDMKAGEISAPFATAFGIHVVKILEPKQLITKPLEQVKGDIRYQLQQQVKKSVLKELLDQSTIKVVKS